MFLKIFLGLFGGIKLEAIKELVGYSNKCILWPGEEPINITLREERWELLSSLSELDSDWGECKDCVEAILNSVDEEDPELEH